MAITIKEIARIAGVSVGTVDRALHNRGRVNPDLAMRINKIARDNGFEPSRAGRALALARKPVKIGVVVHLTKTAFMKQVVDGIQRVKAELEGLGAEIIVRDIATLDAGLQIRALDELLEAGVQGIAISPEEDDALRGRIDSISGEGRIPIVTFNTDMAGTHRMCFVGLDNTRSGRTTAGLMGSIIGEKGKVAVITGHLTNQASNRRVEGFLQEIQAGFPGIHITGTQICFDDDDKAEQLTIQSVRAIPDLDGILVCAGGQAGVCAGLKKLELERRIKVVAYDLIPPTIAGLEEGIIDFVIDQNAYVQGYRPAMILFDRLFGGKNVDQEMIYTDITIKTKYNL